MEEINLKKGILTYKRKLKKGETYRIDRRRKYTSLTIVKKTKIVTGVSSRTSDGKEVIFMDYDKCDLSLVKSDFNVIQNLFDLPPGYIFTTGMEKKNGDEHGNFHVITLCKKRPVEVIEILKHTHIDANYLDSPIRNRQRGWILRIGLKGKRLRPKFLGFIGENKNLDLEISTAHKKLLSKLYTSVKHPKYTKEDSNSKIFFQDYETL
jgi:hypothetical protein